MYPKITIVILLFCGCVRGHDTDHTGDVCETAKIACTCVDEETKEIVPETVYVSFMEGIRHKAKCKNIDPQKVCEDINCQFNANSTRKPALDQELGAGVHPKMFTIPSGLGGKRIVKRDSEWPCELPTLTHSSAVCGEYPLGLHCEIHCLEGYVAHIPGNGTAKKASIYCARDKPKWEPEESIDCTTPQNCRARLIGPGSLTCREPHGETPTCNISCYHDYDHYAVPLKTYVCADDNFGKQLPFCASLVEKRVG